METNLLNILRGSLAVGSGVVIGYAFGLLQNVALLRHLRMEREGKFKSGWSIMPGSGQRTAGLLLALVLVQIVCPLLFVDGIQWAVSAGVVAGYGWVLYHEMRKRIKS